MHYGELAIAKCSVLRPPVCLAPSERRTRAAARGFDHTRLTAAAIVRLGAPGQGLECDTVALSNAFGGEAPHPQRSGDVETCADYAFAQCGAPRAPASTRAPTCAAARPRAAAAPPWRGVGRDHRVPSERPRGDAGGTLRRGRGSRSKSECPS